MALGFLTTRAATDFAMAFSEYRDDFDRLQFETGSWLWSQGLGIPATAVEQFDPNELVRGLTLPGLTLALSVVSAGSLVLLITVFLVVESASIAQKLRGTDRLGRLDVQSLKAAARDVQRYLLIKTVTSAATGLSRCRPHERRRPRTFSPVRTDRVHPQLHPEHRQHPRLASSDRAVLAHARLASGAWPGCRLLLDQPAHRHRDRAALGGAGDRSVAVGGCPLDGLLGLRARVRSVRSSRSLSRSSCG